MVILFDTLSILLPATVLENCLETPGLKPFSTSCAKLRRPLFVQLGSFLIGKPWSSSKFRRLASPSDLYLFLFHLWNCSTCIYLWLSQCRRLSEPYFLSSGWMSSPISMCGLPHITFNLQVELSHLILWLPRNGLSLTINLFVSFYFIHYPYFVWTTTRFCLFFWVELCECHTYILVSPFLLSGHSTFEVITDPFSFWPCVDCHTSFLKWKIHVSYLFSQFW